MAQIFRRWTNLTPRLTMISIVVIGSSTALGMYWYASPYHTDVGYKPKQPVEYSHALHAGTLKLDCRYCHAYVERGPHAGVPSTQVCMNCHRQAKKDSPMLALVRATWDGGAGEESVPWKRVHKVPDFAYFDHSAHVGVGVGSNRAAIGCETCHGRVDTMLVVRQEEPLSMGWCVACHSDPGPSLRPVEAMTAMGWRPDLAWRVKALEIAATLNPPGSLSRAMHLGADGKIHTYATASCSGCHR